jgi:CheY-like chemotaxis protein
MAAPKIIIVEDDQFLQQIYARGLAERGYQTVVTGDGAEALRILSAKNDIALMIMDLKLPSMDGATLLTQLQEKGILDALPFFVITNMAEDDFKPICDTMHAKGCFTKSALRFEDVLERIDAILMPGRKNTKPSSTVTPFGNAPAAMKSGKARVMVVEDDPFLLQIYRQNLEERGYAVFAAAGGREALEAIDTDAHWDLMILDLLMPEVDGFTVLETLKKKGITPTLPIIVLTNLSQQTDEEKAKNLGAIDFAVKSELSFDDIVAHVENALAKTSKDSA